MMEKPHMEQLRRDVSEVIVLESLNAQRIDRINDGMTSLGETISRLALSMATQAQAHAGFRELYAKEIAFIHRSVEEVKDALNHLKAAVMNEKDKISAVEKDIAVARGSIKGAVMSWSGFVALIAFLADKAVEIVSRR